MVGYRGRRSKGNESKGIAKVVWWEDGMEENCWEGRNPSWFIRPQEEEKDARIVSVPLQGVL